MAVLTSSHFSLPVSSVGLPENAVQLSSSQKAAGLPLVLVAPRQHAQLMSSPCLQAPKSTVTLRSPLARVVTEGQP